MAQRQAERATSAPGASPSPRMPLLARLNARGFRLLMLADGLVLVVSMVLLTWVRIRYASVLRDLVPVVFTGSERLTAPLQNYAVGYGAFTLLFIATYYFGGLYERELRLGQRAVLPQVA